MANHKPLELPSLGIGRMMSKTCPDLTKLNTCPDLTKLCVWLCIVLLLVGLAVVVVVYGVDSGADGYLRTYLLPVMTTVNDSSAPLISNPMTSSPTLTLSPSTSPTLSPSISPTIPFEFAFNVTEVENDWGVDIEHETWRYVPKDRPLKRRNHDGAMHCLANKTIAFIGDSRVRYQFLALEYFVATGLWPQCGEGRFSQLNSCSFVHENMWRSWIDFYQNTNANLNRNSSSELCFCYRIQQDFSLTRENRFFHSDGKWGPVRLIYLQSFHDTIFLGRAYPPFNDLKTPRCATSTCTGQPEVSTTLEGLLPMLSDLHLTHLFASTGWIERDIGCMLTKFESSSGVQTFEITHPAYVGKRAGIPLDNPSLSKEFVKQSCGAKVFDRYTPTLGLNREQYFDPVHILSSGNQELNHLLLDLLCN